MEKKLKIEIPVQGWKQFLTSKREMLDSYDRARKQSESHEVATYHGKCAEAEFRKWLLNFLPKRYGVTSGYIVSPGLKSTQKTPHYDVIIYDQLESPVLWVEGSPDASPQGKSHAIPVEHVRCVLEVKANLSSTSSKGAMEHLKDLLPLLSGTDNPSDKYKLHLSPNFWCGLVFFDLKNENQFSEAALSKLIAGIDLRGFFGGVVLRGEGHQKDDTGRLALFQSENSSKSTIGKNKQSLLNFGMTQTLQTADNLHSGAMLTWSEMDFAKFGFDVLAMIQGTYDPRSVSSFHGMGTSELEHFLALGKEDKKF